MVDASLVLAVATPTATLLGVLANARYGWFTKQADAEAADDSRADARAEAKAERLDQQTAALMEGLRIELTRQGARFDDLEARFLAQGRKLASSEDRVYALERDVYAGQQREREMATTITRLQDRLEQQEKA